MSTSVGASGGLSAMAPRPLTWRPIRAAGGSGNVPERQSVLALIPPIEGATRPCAQSQTSLRLLDRQFQWVRAVGAMGHHIRREGVHDQVAYTGPDPEGPWNEPGPGHPRHSILRDHRGRVDRSPRTVRRNRHCRNRPQTHRRRAVDAGHDSNLVGFTSEASSSVTPAPTYGPGSRISPTGPATTSASGTLGQLLTRHGLPGPPMQSAYSAQLAKLDRCWLTGVCGHGGARVGGVIWDVEGHARDLVGDSVPAVSTPQPQQRVG